MQQHRVLIAFGIAWLSALVLSWWVYQRSSAPVERDVVYAVAAARDLPLGKRIVAEDIKLIAIERKDQPKAIFVKAAEVVDRSLAVPVVASELVLAGKLAAKGSGEGLTALIEPGTRAISVQVNEISGVSGFVQPGTRVDVLFTRVFSNGDAATTTILQNIKVIAYGRQTDPAAARVDPRDTSRPTVATLMVSQEQAEKLVLAAQRGRIQLVLRNGLDEETLEPLEAIKSADLGIEEPVKPGAKVVTAPPPPPPVVREIKIPPPPPPPPHVVRIYRGDKVSEETLK